MVQDLIGKLEEVTPRHAYGRVKSVQGHLVEVAGPLFEMSVGSLIGIQTPEREETVCEVVGFAEDHALCLPYSDLEACGLVAALSLKDQRLSDRPKDGSVGLLTLLASRLMIKDLC